MLCQHFFTPCLMCNGGKYTFQTFTSGKLNYFHAKEWMFISGPLVQFVFLLVLFTSVIAFTRKCLHIGDFKSSKIFHTSFSHCSFPTNINISYAFFMLESTNSEGNLFILYRSITYILLILLLEKLVNSATLLVDVYDPGPL